MSGRSQAELTEQALARIERDRDPGVIPSLVATIRQQQHDLDSLRLALEVARSDREELRLALLRARGGAAGDEGSAGAPAR